MAAKKDAEDEKARQAVQRKTVSNIIKRFGKGSIMKMSDVPDKIPVIPSGSLALDQALGVGGYPKGRIIEIFGPDSSGKTTEALEAAAQCQKQGGSVAYIDAENALDPDYARNLGVNIQDLWLIQPDDGDQAMDICNAIVASGAWDLVVIDSVAALVPRQELQGDISQNHVGLQARLMSRTLRTISGPAKKNMTTCIFINQTRDKVGVMFGSPETTPGGKALKFYASVRIRISRGKPVKASGKEIGRQARIKIRKNKVAAPDKKCTVDIIYNKGFSRLGELIDMAADKKIIDKAGAWYSYNGTRIGQGKENAKLYLKTHPEMAKEVNAKTRKAYGIYTSPSSNKAKSSNKTSAKSKKSSKSSTSKKK